MSVMSEYATIRDEIGPANFELIEKYLETRPAMLLSEVYYTRDGWESFERWTRQAQEEKKEANQ